MPAHTLSTEEYKQFNLRKVHNTFSGGQKTVFIVETNAGKYFALKYIHGGLNERTRREIEFYKSHEHFTGIPKIIDVHSTAEDTYIMEEFIQGDVLSSIYSKYQNDSNLILNLLQGIYDVMYPIWMEERIHRDLKPANIIVRADGTPVVIDFGILKSIGDPTITQAGFQPRSIPFVSPEQIEGDKTKISYRTDLFCIGVIGYFLYTGTFPFGCNEDEIEASYSQQELCWQESGDHQLDRILYEIFKKAPSDRARKIVFMEVN